MDDLSICKRIAEIDKCTISTVTVKNGQVRDENPLLGFAVINPLTDDALCFQLMVKYSVDLTHDFSGLWCANMNPSYDFDESVECYAHCVYDKNPNWAICLAIIEAHKESNK